MDERLTDSTHAKRFHGGRFIVTRYHYHGPDTIITARQQPVISNDPMQSISAFRQAKRSEMSDGR